MDWKRQETLVFLMSIYKLKLQINWGGGASDSQLKIKSWKCGGLLIRIKEGFSYIFQNDSLTKAKKIMLNSQLW